MSLKYFLFVILLIFNEQLIASNFDLGHYPMFLEKLLYYKQDNFKAFYGGPIDKKKGGVTWMMPLVFEDEEYNTRAVYELAFVNCSINNAKGADVYFLSVSDIDIKFKNTLSEGYAIFSKLLHNQNQSNKYIVIRQADVAMVFFPDIFIQHENNKKNHTDYTIIKKFLRDQFGANVNNAQVIYEEQKQDRILFQNDNVVEYEPIFVKTQIHDKILPFSIFKFVQKKDTWKVYYVILRGLHKSLDRSNKKNVLVRVDSGCVSGQIYDDDACDCIDQLHHGLHQISQDETGNAVIIHIPTHDGRGYGTAPKAETEIYKRGGRGRVHIAKTPLDTVAAASLLYGNTKKYDLRTFDGAATLLKHIGITKVLLLTDNKNKVTTLKKHGIKVIRKRTETKKESCAQHLQAKSKSDVYYEDL